MYLYIYIHIIYITYFIYILYYINLGIYIVFILYITYYMYCMYCKFNILYIIYRMYFIYFYITIYHIILLISDLVHVLTANFIYLASWIRSMSAASDLPNTKPPVGDGKWGFPKMGVPQNG